MQKAEESKATQKGKEKSDAHVDMDKMVKRQMRKEGKRRTRD